MWRREPKELKKKRFVCRGLNPHYLRRWLFGVFREVITWPEAFRVSPNPEWRCLYKKRTFGHRHTHRADHGKTGNDQLEAKERGLRRSQPADTFPADSGHRVPLELSSSAEVTISLSTQIFIFSLPELVPHNTEQYQRKVGIETICKPPCAFLKVIVIYLPCVWFWLGWVFTAARGLSLVGASGRLTTAAAPVAGHGL